MTKPLFLSPLFLLILVLTIHPVYASDVDFPNFPEALSDKTNLPLFASQILCSLVLMLIFLLPLNAVIRKERFLPNLIMGLGLMAFCVAIEWLPYWLFLLLALIIASLWATKIKKAFGR